MNREIQTALPIVLSTAVAIGLSGCADKTVNNCNKIPTLSKKQSVSSNTTVGGMDEKDRQIAALQIAIAEALKQKKNPIVKVVVKNKGASLYPPNPQSGQCYTRVLTPEKYETKTKKILVKDATEDIKIIPAQYQDAIKKVKVKESTTKLITIPATYKTITQKILVSPASEKIVTIPATYETKIEKILVKPAHTFWKKGSGLIQKVDDTTGEILCLVTVPPTYKTIKRKVVKTPASTKVIPIPAVYRTITRQVIDRPASTKTVTIPAEYKTVSVRELVKPATIKKTTIPATYRVVKQQVKAEESVINWKPVQCKSKVNFYNKSSKKSTGKRKIDISSVQQALKEAGFNPGPIDGIIGVKTKRALKKYQKVHDLPTNKGLTRATLDSLGLF
jgi:hypothetical protein